MFFRKKSTESEVAQPKKSRFRGILTGVVVGGAVGSVVSLLFAPKKGSETREELYDKGKELFDDGKSKAEEFLDKYKK